MDEGCIQELGINERSSTLLTRYSIANHLKQLGASTEVIKDMLGHSSVKTTEIYLNSFQIDVTILSASNDCR